MTDEHTIAELYYNMNRADCPQCSPTTPHSVIFRCTCGEVATGVRDHIWTLTPNDDGTVSLSPSVNWLNDPKDASKGSHLHEFTRAPVAKSMAEVHGVE